VIYNQNYFRRWLRLLFGREVNLHDLLILWDAIFGVGENLALTYFIVVAMLVHIRHEREFSVNTT
jgi:hypothetical protein